MVFENVDIRSGLSGQHPGPTCIIDANTKLNSREFRYRTRPPACSLALFCVSSFRQSLCFNSMARWIVPGKEPILFRERVSGKSPSPRGACLSTCLRCAPMDFVTIQECRCCQTILLFGVFHRIFYNLRQNFFESWCRFRSTTTE